METLAKASEKAIQTAQTKRSENTLMTYEQKQELARKKVQIAEIVRQSYDIFHTYGKTPEQFHTILKAFDKTLSGYTMDRIASAFDEYLETGTAMPLPADIIKIIKRENLPEGIGTKMPDFPDSPDVNDWQEKSEEEKQEFKNWLESEKRKIRGGLNA
jgi:hypothetical protein